MPRMGSSLSRHSRRRRVMISMFSEYSEEYEAVDPSPYIEAGPAVIPVTSDATGPDFHTLPDEVATAESTVKELFADDEAAAEEHVVAEAVTIQELFAENTTQENGIADIAAADANLPVDFETENDIQWGEQHRLDEEFDSVVQSVDGEVEGTDHDFDGDADGQPTSDFAVASKSNIDPFTEDAADVHADSARNDIAPFPDERIGFDAIRELFHQEQPSLWMFLGDEITLGSRQHVNIRGFVDLFAERVRTEMRRMQDVVVNVGVPGRTASTTLHDLQDRLRFNPSVVALQFGLHDVQEKVWEPERFRIQMLTIIDQIRMADALPLLQTPPRMKLSNKSSQKRFIALLEVLFEVAMDEDVPLIDHMAFHAERDVNGLSVNPENGLFVTKNHADARMAYLLFQELDIFDQQSELCGYVSKLV